MAHATPENQAFYNEVAHELQSRGIRSEMGSADDRGYDQLKIKAYKSDITVGVGYDPSTDGFETFISWNHESDGDFLDGASWAQRPTVGEVDNKVAEFYAEATRRGLDGKI